MSRRQGDFNGFSEMPKSVDELRQFSPIGPVVSANMAAALLWSFVAQGGITMPDWIESALIAVWLLCAWGARFSITKVRTPSVVSHTDGSLLSAARARVTFARMSSAFLVHTKVVGFPL